MLQSMEFSKSRTQPRNSNNKLKVEVQDPLFKIVENFKMVLEELQSKGRPC